ncbi:MAG: 1-acyl-sn-glycerol-3-phosphate acyltransferase [Deltaproteobacteria bacterium]|nr:1-acyl-sn-glycerol-3-phosphate acyltransferase [Deltaproteobacteria bacterium]
MASIDGPSGEQSQHNEPYAECLYEKDNFSLLWLVKKVLSRVRFDDEQAETLRRLSERGVVVYALKQKSQLNSLILRELSARKGIPRPVYSHGVNMNAWQPFPVAVNTFFHTLLRPFFKRTFKNPYDTGFLKQLVRQGNSAIIHLGGSEFFEDPHADDAIAQLIEAQMNMEKPIFIVPEMVTYGRRREREQENVINILAGQSDNAGAIQRIATFMRYSNKATVISADAVDLSEFIRTNDRLNASGVGFGAVLPEVGRQLRRELIDRIDEEKEATVGPILKSRDEFIGMVLSDEGLKRNLEQLAADGRVKYPALVKEARKYLMEIASDYSEIFIEIWDKVLTWLWNNIYDGVFVDQEGLAKIRQVSKRMPFVIIPCHRSHIDYFLLSYVFYKNNIQLPFIAAGTNLLFWPVGYLFRKSSAFFLRRTFRGNVLYGHVFSKYVEVLLREGLPLEFFIEGGRSRTGKMVMPKYGLLAIIIQAFQDGACEDLAIVPVYIGYDRVIEEKSYLMELGGIPKAKEKATDVLKTGSVVRKRYGRVYVGIGEPMLMKAYLESQEKPFVEMTLDERQSLYRKIGYEVVLEINKVSVVTPFALVASGLLCQDRRGISQEDLLYVLNIFHDYLSHRKVSFAATFANREKAIGDALALFDQSEIISKMGAEEEDQELKEIVYSLEDGKRLNLEYYKNNILHFFLPVTFVAASMLSYSESTIALNQVMEDFRFFKGLFWHEFIFDEHKDDLDEVNDVFSYLHNQGMIAGEERDGQVWIELKGRGRVKLMPFAGLIHNYIESYWVVLRGCSYLKKGAKPEKEWLRHLNRLGTLMYKKGEIRRSEALSQSNYESAIEFLKEKEILIATEVLEKGDKRALRNYSLSEDKGALDALRRRLFKFL